MDSSIEQRRAQRFIFREPVLYQIRTNEEWKGSLSANLSEGGILIISNDFVPLNTQIYLQIHMNKNRIAELIGTVMRVQKLPYSDYFHLGLEFKDPIIFSKEEIKSQGKIPNN